MTLPQWSRPGTGSRPGTPVVFNRGRSAELAHHHHDRRIEHPAAVQIFDQGADGRVDQGKHPLHAAFEAGMKVPTAERERDEPNARLDQPAGEQCALAPLVPAVAVAEPRDLPG